MLGKLFSQTAIYGVSATVAKFLNYLLTPYLTRILSQDVYGEVSYLYALIPFANVVLTMGFSTGYFRYASRCESALEKRRLFTTLWSSVSLFSLIVCSLVALFFPSVEVFVMLALILVDNIAAIPLSMLRERGMAFRYTIVNVVGVVVNVAMCVAFYSYIDGAASSAVWVLLANLIASTVSLLLLIPSIVPMVAGWIDRAVLRKVAVYSLPLMVAGIMGVASGYIDRQMIRWILPEDVALSELGVYSAVAKIASLMVIFRQIYTLGAEPFFLQKFSHNDFCRLTSAALRYFLGAGIVIFLSMMLFTDLFSLIIGSGFRAGMDILPILLLSNLLAGVLVNLSFWYKVADMTRYAIFITLSGIVVTVLMNLVLIPDFGYGGAAWARLGGTATMVVLSYAMSKRHYRIDYQPLTLIFYVLYGTVIYLAGEYTSRIDTNWLRWGLNFAMIAIFCIIFALKERIIPIGKWR